jgi:hypothetical protein
VERMDSIDEGKDDTASEPPSGTVSGDRNLLGQPFESGLMAE